MKNQIKFGAPWGKSLILMTCFASVLLLGLPVFGIFNHASGNLISFYVMTIFPSLIFFGSLLFIIRGYILSEDTLLIQRLFWNTEISLTKLISAEVKPNAMHNSIRTFGNGGLFSFCGKFRNTELGSYRAYVTNPTNTVVLKFVQQKIVVSPDRPEIFVQEINSWLRQGTKAAN